MDDSKDPLKNKDEFTLILRKRLKTELDYQSMTAADLARKTSVPKQVISDWLAGVMPRRLDHLKRVAHALSLTIDELCFGGGQNGQNGSVGVVGLERMIGAGEDRDGIVGRYEVVVQRIR
ncbi:MAG: helix-turn-helix transcriptional regulator [Deltaproteobacteria bacterium]|nr:helix-turn-helix transcriptional regulator [Deltaproteobacteria bacterium]